MLPKNIGLEITGLEIPSSVLARAEEVTARAHHAARRHDGRIAADGARSEA
jgi:hypothetical protein